MAYTLKVGAQLDTTNIEKGLQQYAGKVKSIKIDLNTGDVVKQVTELSNKMGVVKTIVQTTNGTFLTTSNNIQKCAEQQEILKQRISLSVEQLNRMMATTSNLSDKFGDNSGKFSEVQTRISSLQSAYRGLIDSNQELNSVEVQRLNLQQREIQESISLLRVQNQTISSGGSAITSLVTQYLSITAVIQATISMMRNMIDEVFKLDASLTELAKVSNIVKEDMGGLTEQAFKVGEAVSATGTQVLDSVANFKRAGYDMQESFDLGESALMMKNIADGISDVDTSSQVIISTLKGFKLSVEDTEHILDALNNVSNNTASSFSGLADVLQRSSATMSDAGNSLEETIGLATGMMEILGQDKSETIGRSLNSITLRLRNLTAVGEDGFEGISKLNKELEKMGDKYGTGASIFDNNGNLKTTYEIMGDIAELYPKMTENERQYIAIQAAGKTQISAFNSAMQNWEGVLRATDLALNSSGSAMQENAVFQESLQGRVNQLSSAFSEFSNKSINSEFVSAVLQATTGVLNFITAIGGLPTVLGSIAVAFAVLNAESIKTFALGLLQGSQVLSTFITTLVTSGSVTRAYANAQTALTFATQGATIATVALKVAMGGIIALGIMGVMYGIKKATEDTTVSIEEQTASLQTLKSEMETLKTDISTLSSKENLTEEEQLRLDLLRQTLALKQEIAQTEEKEIQFKNFSEAFEQVNSLKEGTDEALESYKKLAEETNGNSITPKSLKEMQESAGKLQEKYNALQESLIKVNEALVGADEGQRNALQPQKEYLESTIKLIAELLGLKTSLENVAVTTNDDTDETNKYALALKDLKDELEKLEQLTDDTVSSLNTLNDAIAKQANGVSLSASEIDNLLKRYPELQGHIQTTSDGYMIEKGVLEQLREQSYNTYQQQIEGSSKTAQQVVSDCQAKIRAIISEMTALKNLQEMYSSTNRTILNPSGLDRSLLMPEISSALDSQIEKSQSNFEATNKLLEESLALLEELGVGSARVDVVYENLGNKIKEVADKASKSAKKIKDYADEIAKLGVTIKDAQTQLAEFKKGFDLFKGGYVNDAFREQKLSITELEEGYKSAKTQLEKLVVQYNALKKNTKGDEAKKKLDEINEKIKEQTTLIGKLTSQAKAYNEELKNSALQKLKDERSGLNDILSQTIELIKYEKNLEKEAYEEELRLIKESNKAQQEALKERVEKEKESINTQLDNLKESVDKRKRLIKEEADAQKKALKEQLSAYQDIINKRKEALEKQEEERSYQEKLAEEQAKLVDMQQKLQELKNASDTADGRAKYLEQLEKVKEQEKVITDLQREWEIAKQKETLDQMLKDKEDNINSQIEAVEDAYDEQDKALDDSLSEQEKKLKEQLKYWETYLDTETKKLEDSLTQQEAHYQKYIDEINKYLKEEGTIRLDAMKEIETNSSSLYQRLIDYNKLYSTGIDKDVTSAWDLATEALRKYADAQGSVLSAMGKIDALEDYMGNEDNSVKVNEKDNDKITTEKPKTEAEKLKEERVNLQKYYHDQMQIAIKTNNEGLKKWIKAERKKNQFDSDTGTDLYKYHTGGIAGKGAGETSSSLAPNEVLAKLLKGEVTATESQASNFLRKTLPTLIGMNGQTVNNTQGGNTYHLEINTTGNVDSSTYARLKSDMEKMFKTLDSNKAMFKNGNVRNARTLSL